MPLHTVGLQLPTSSTRRHSRRTVQLCCVLVQAQRWPGGGRRRFDRIAALARAGCVTDILPSTREDSVSWATAVIISP